MNIELTKDAEYMLCAIYKSYKDKRKSGISKSDAKLIGSAQSIHDELMDEWSFDDVDETCRELDRAGFLYCEYADDSANDTVLTDKAIVYMENRFANGLIEIIENMAKIKSALFF